MTDRFTQVVLTYGPKLQAEFGFDAVQSCGPWGNGGRETGGFVHYQEIGSGPNSGGRGWFQWTAARRISFLAWCKAHRLDPKSDEASYGYLCFELHGTYRGVVTALKRCKTLEAAVQTFERQYEGAGVKAMGERVAWARKALAILQPGHPASVATAAKPRARKQADRHAVAEAHHPRHAHHRKA